jgi:RND family efflux transporter MFP subunit
VVFPQEGAPTQEIVLPGNTQAFSDAPIYARTNGYLKHWYFDIGAHVQKGQLLAEIETPEIDQQLLQARADLDTAQANLNIAKITASRWQDLVSTGSVSQQETDQAVSNLSAVKAAAESSAANVRRLEQLQSFEKIYAPFDGIITARNTDVGALIDAGASAQPKELFHLAAIRKLRLYVSVPEVYSRASRSGAPATLTLDEFPGQTFHGTLVRNSNSIDIASRTLLVEVDVENPTGQLLPGAYVFVHLKLPDQTRSVTIPSNTLIFRKEGLQVGLVRNGKAELVSVKISRDYGNSVEIVSGLQPTDAVIVDPSDSLVAGMFVRLSNKPGGGAGR